MFWKVDHRAADNSFSRELVLCERCRLALRTFSCTSQRKPPFKKLPPRERLPLEFFLETLAAPGSARRVRRQADFF